MKNSNLFVIYNKNSVKDQTTAPVFSPHQLDLNKNVERLSALSVIKPAQRKKPAVLGDDGKQALTTPGQLRGYPGLEHLTDRQAQEDIDTLEKLATILLEFYGLNKYISIDNQQVVYSKFQKCAA